MQFTNDQANIGPIVVNLNKINEGVYSIFGGYLSQKGNWNIHLTAQRLNAYDLNYEFDVDLKQQHHQIHQHLTISNKSIKTTNHILL